MKPVWCGLTRYNFVMVRSNQTAQIKFVYDRAVTSGKAISIKIKLCRDKNPLTLNDTDFVHPKLVYGSFLA